VFFAIGNLLWFIVAILIGTVAGALAVIAAKQFIKADAKAASEQPELAAV
jgi:PTS system fructose-specific IIC component